MAYSWMKEAGLDQLRSSLWIMLVPWVSTSEPSL